MSYSRTTLLYIYVSMLCLPIMHCGTDTLCEGNPCDPQPTEAPFQEDTDSELSGNSWSSIATQLGSINPLIWIIVFLITVVCCLSASLLCYCILQYRFNEQLKEARIQSLSELSIHQQHARDQRSVSLPPLKMKNYQSRTQTQETLHPPKRSPHSHASDSQLPPPVMVPLPRAFSADAVAIPSINIHQRNPQRNTRHRSANSANTVVINGYNTQDPMPMWNPQGYNVQSRDSGRNMSVTTYETEFSNGTTDMTYMTRLSSHPSVDQIQHYQHKPSTKSTQSHRKSTGSLKSIPSHRSTQELQAHTAGTFMPPPPPPISYKQQSYSSQQSYVQVPVVPVVNMVKVNTPPPSSRQRVNMNLEHAMDTLAEEEKTYLNAPNTGKHEAVWTEASIGGMSTLTFKDTPSVSDGLVGGLPMFGAVNEDR